MPRRTASSRQSQSTNTTPRSELSHSTNRPSLIKTIVPLFLVFSLAVALVMLLIADISSTAPQAPATFAVPGAVPGTATSTPSETPEPWFFDEANNQHWNPTVGHNHWHQGPPPPPEERSTNP